MRTSLLIGIQCFCIVLSSFICVARIYVAYLGGMFISRKKRSLALILEIIGFVCFLCSWILVIFVNATYLNQARISSVLEAHHVDETIISARLATSKQLQMLFASVVATLTAQWLLKASFLLAYAPVYSQISRRLQRLFAVTVVITLLTFLGAMSAYLFYCYPIERNWEETGLIATPSAGHCHVVIEFHPLLVSSVLAVISDFPLLAVPVLVIWSLDRCIGRRRDRYGLATIVILGSISIGVTLWRVIDAKISGYVEGQGLPLGKRNEHVVGNVVKLVSFQIAFSLPSLRAFARNTMSGSGIGGRRSKNGLYGESGAMDSDCDRLTGGPLSIDEERPAKKVTPMSVI